MGEGWGADYAAWGGGVKGMRWDCATILYVVLLLQQSARAYWTSQRLDWSALGLIGEV